MTDPDTKHARMAREFLDRSFNGQPDTLRQNMIDALTALLDAVRDEERAHVHERLKFRSCCCLKDLESDWERGDHVPPASGAGAEMGACEMCGGGKGMYRECVCPMCNGTGRAPGKRV